MSGPLRGIRVLELASLAPGPFAATMLSDLGAEVLRIDRPAGDDPAQRSPGEPLGRGRRSAAVNLRHPEAAELVLRLVERADVLIEGFRPGVCERLGIGPDVCHGRNEKLIFARMTGWGQHGPLAARAGHDINYLAVSGALHPVGPHDAPPVPPVNYVADFGGGGMLLVCGILAALFERQGSRKGQVVDAAMTDGAGLMTTMLHGLLARGDWDNQRGGNLLDGSAPFYRCYQCADGGYVAVGALEPRFFAELVEVLELSEVPDQYDTARWPRLTRMLTDAFAAHDRDHWQERFSGTDACVTPVLSLAEAPHHPHAVARESFTTLRGVTQPAPAPRLSASPAAIAGPAPHVSEHTEAALRDWGVPDTEIARLRETGAAV